MLHIIMQWYVTTNVLRHPQHFNARTHFTNAVSHWDMSMHGTGHFHCSTVRQVGLLLWLGIINQKKPGGFKQFPAQTNFHWEMRLTESLSGLSAIHISPLKSLSSTANT